MAFWKYVYALLIVIGFVLSVYSVVVEHSILSNENYTAFCDVNEKISCSAVLSSEYSFGFGIVEKLLGKNHILNQPNSYYGVMFYPIQLLISMFWGGRANILLLIVNTLVCVISCYLIYILFFVMNKVCIVCMGIHLVNFLLLTINCLMLKTTLSPKPKKE